MWRVRSKFKKNLIYLFIFTFGMSEIRSITELYKTLLYVFIYYFLFKTFRLAALACCTTGCKV